MGRFASGLFDGFFDELFGEIFGNCFGGVFGLYVNVLTVCDCGFLLGRELWEKREEVAALADEDLTSDDKAQECYRAAESDVTHVVRANNDTADGNEHGENDRSDPASDFAKFFVLELHDIGEHDECVGHTCRASVT